MVNKDFQCINFCILALGSGQSLLYRLGSGLGLVSVSFSFTVLYCVPRTFAIAALCDSGPESYIVVFAETTEP